MREEPGENQNQSLWRRIVAEPVLFLYFLGYMIFMPTIQQYVYHIISQNHGIDDTKLYKHVDQQCTNESVNANSSQSEKVRSKILILTHFHFSK